MKTQFALDVRLARKKAGLTQRDGAHLLEVHRGKLSALEHGTALPTLREIVTLSLIYGRSFESLFGEQMMTARRRLLTQLTTLPETARECVGTMNRRHTLDRLRHRLEAELHDHGA